jgi:hypothetical protein
MGHLERDKKFRMAVGMLDHSAGIAVPRARSSSSSIPASARPHARAAISAVSKQLEELRARLEGKGRVVPLGSRVMGRVRDWEPRRRGRDLAAFRLGPPVLDFAHMHATSDGAYTDVEPFAAALEAVDEVLEADAPFHIHSPTSPTRTAARPSTSRTARERCARIH